MSLATPKLPEPMSRICSNAVVHPPAHTPAATGPVRNWGGVQHTPQSKASPAWCHERMSKILVKYSHPAHAPLSQYCRKGCTQQRGMSRAAAPVCKQQRLAPATHKLKLLRHQSPFVWAVGKQWAPIRCCNAVGVLRHYQRADQINPNQALLCRIDRQCIAQLFCSTKLCVCDRVQGGPQNGPETQTIIS